MADDILYLDNNATTRVADEVLAAMEPYYRHWYGNAHALHSLGRAAHEAVEEARGEVGRLLGVEAREVIFTSCGTEGNAMVIRGLLDANPSRRRVVTTAVEHPSVMSLLRALELADAIELVVVPVGNDGEIDLEAMSRAVDGGTLLVSVMLAQNETGVLHPIDRIAAIAHANDALMHIDAVQAAGKVAIDATALGADFITISGHKLHAPKGVGALTMRRGLGLAPLWYGGGQELGMRSGTEPVPSIAGFGTAARLARENLHLFESRVRPLRDRFEEQVRSNIDEVSVNGSTLPRLPNTSNVSFHGLQSDDLVRALDARGICISGGAACHAGKPEPTATMQAMRKPRAVALGAVRFSLSRYTTEEEMERTAAAVEAVVREARALSPLTVQ
jgi:cysteine desulfurase